MSIHQPHPAYPDEAPLEEVPAHQALLQTAPLHGVRVVEFRGMGPGPFAAMLLADLGAEVLLVEPPASRAPATHPRILLRGRRSLHLDLKAPGAVEVAKRLLGDADVLIEGFRPGVMERLGLGPRECEEVNERLIFARVTGWGQEGPLAARAGHDINYLAVSGMLGRLGPDGAPPTPPGNYLGDLGAGGMMLAVAVLAALREREASGRGQVLDVNILDAAALFLTGSLAQQAQGALASRGRNLLDSGAPYYCCYLTADGKYIAVGCLEEEFYQNFLRVLNLAPQDIPDRRDRTTWPQLRILFQGILGTRTRADWVAAAEGVDACLTPVLDLDEVAAHPHNAARRIFGNDANTSPAPAPRFSRSVLRAVEPPPAPGQHTRDLLAQHGYSETEIAQLSLQGVLG